MRKLLIAASALTACAAAPALAQDMGSTGLYGSIGAGTVDGDGVIQGRIGTKLNTWFAVEGEAAVGVEDDGVDNQFGFFGKAGAPVSDSVELFARAGWARTNGRPDGDGFAYGAGAQWNPNGGPDGFRLDYTRYETGGDHTADGVTVSYVRKF
jgi:hypothetical protein